MGKLNLYEGQPLYGTPLLGGNQCDSAVDSDLEANQRTIAAYTPPPEVMIGEGGMGEIGAEQTTGSDVTGQGSGPAQDADAASSVALASAALLIALASLI